MTSALNQPPCSASSTARSTASAWALVTPLVEYSQSCTMPAHRCGGSQGPHPVSFWAQSGTEAPSVVNPTGTSTRSVPSTSTTSGSPRIQNLSSPGSTGSPVTSLTRSTRSNRSGRSRICAVVMSASDDQGPHA